MLQAIQNVTYFVDDMAAAVAWYKDALGLTPAWESPHYTGFPVGGQDLGLHPTSGEDKPGSGGQTAFWRVDDVKAALAHLVSKGAAELHAVTEVGGGRRIASVRDPFGNVLGLVDQGGAG